MTIFFQFKTKLFVEKNYISCVGSGNNELRKIINESIDPNKIREMLNKIEDPIDYINAITKLLPYAVGKKKMIEILKILDKS